MASLRLPLAYAASLVAMAGAASAGCGGSAFQAGDAGSGPTEASTVVDSGGPVEAGEAAPPVEAGASWCAGHTETFCEDFDEYASVTALVGSSTWPMFSQANGSFQFDSLNAPSPPNALDVVGDDDANVLIVKTFTGVPAMPQRVSLTFDLRVDGAGTSGLLSAAGFAAIAFGTSISDGYVALAIGDGPSLVAFWADSSTTGSVDAGTFKPAVTTGPFPSAGVWAGSYTLEIDYTSTYPAGCVQVYTAGATKQLSTCLPLPAQFAMPKVLSIALGDVSGGLGKTGSVEIEFDNVTFDIK